MSGSGAPTGSTGAFGGAAAPGGGGGGPGASAGAAGAALQVPPFGGDDVLGQLNVWAARVDQRLEALARSVEEAQGRSILSETHLQSEIEAVEAKVLTNLQQMADAGLAALTKTIDDFKIELGKHEYYHNQARSSVEQVVASATSKFQELERIQAESQQQMQANVLKLIDEFNQEHHRREAAERLLRDQLQAKFEELEGLPRQMQGGAAAAASTTGGDPLQAPGGDAWARPQAAPGPAGAPPAGLEASYAAPQAKCFSVQGRKWGDNKRIDLAVSPEAYLTWRDRALGHLAKDRADMRRLLVWAEKQTVEIDAQAETRGAAEAGLVEPVDDDSCSLLEAIKCVIHDNLLSRARTCGDGRGLELWWRKLHSEWEGQLWEALPAWEQLGLEVVSGGYPLPDWLKANSLEKLLPTDMVQTVIGRPELAAYAPKLAWVKAQMEHAKGSSRAAHYGPGTGRKDAADNSMDVGNLNAEALREENTMGEGVLANVQEAVVNVIYAMMEGKGKGNGKGKCGRGGFRNPYRNKGGSKGMFGKGPGPAAPPMGHFGGKGD